MNLDVLKKAGIDYDDGVRRFMGKAALYEELLLRFTEDETFDSVSKAYGEGKQGELMENAHELKGMSGNLSLTPLYRAASALVTLLRSDGCRKEALDAAYLLIEKEYTAIREAIIIAAQP